MARRAGVVAAGCVLGALVFGVWYWFQIDRWATSFELCGERVELAEGYRVRPADEQFGEIGDGRVEFWIVPPEGAPVPQTTEDVFASEGTLTRLLSESGGWPDSLSEALESPVDDTLYGRSVWVEFPTITACRLSANFTVGDVVSRSYERPWHLSVAGNDDGSFGAT